MRIIFHSHTTKKEKELPQKFGFYDFSHILYNRRKKIHKATAIEQCTKEVRTNGTEYRINNINILN